MNSSVKRRHFLKGALTAVALFSLGKIGTGNIMFEEDVLSKTFFINPAYKEYITAEGEMILETNLPDGKIQFIKCQGLEMDVLQLIREKSIGQEFIIRLAEKYHLTKQEVISKSISLIEKLYRLGILIDKNSKINIRENVVRDTENK